jgi:DNA-binding transcriptional MerR regulator
LFFRRIEEQTTSEIAIAAFTAAEVQRLTALSARRLQYWDETDFIRPSVASRLGRGWPRLYSFQDLVQLRVAGQLRDQLSLQALRRLKAALDVEAPFAEVRFLVTSSNEVIYVGPTGQHEAAKAPGQIAMTIDVPLREIRSELEKKIGRLRQRHGIGKVESERGVLAGKGRVAGTRITPAAIEGLLAAGWTDARIMEEFPDLRSGDLRAARARKTG